MLPRDESGLDSERMDQALAFLKKGSVLQGLPPDRHRKIARRLDEQLRRPERRRLPIPALAALGILLFTGTAVALVGGHLERLPLVGGLFVPREPGVPPAHASKSTGRKAAASASVDTPAAATVEAPAPVALPSAEVTPIPMGHPSAQLEGPGEGLVAPAPERPARVYPTPGRNATGSRPKPAASRETRLDPSTIALESRSFAVALELWHRQHDARRALAALDAHERRFPGGEMSLEIQITRAELFLELGQPERALAELDPLVLVDVPHARELRVVRGELRIKAGRCNEGKADLQGIAVGSDALARRAAKALSDCH